MPDAIRWFLLTVPHADKLGHIAVYGGLAFVVGAICSRLSERWGWAFGAIFAWTIGFADEYRQIGIRGRDAGVSDLLANAIGIGVTAYVVRRRSKATDYRFEGDAELAA